MQQTNSNYEVEDYQPVNPLVAFATFLAGLLLLIIVVAGLIAGWHTFLAEASTIVQVVVTLAIVAIPTTIIGLGAHKGHMAWISAQMHREALGAVRDKRRMALERHELDLELARTRLHADERGNRPAVIMGGQVITLPSGNFAQPVPTTYSPHITNHYQKPVTVTEVENEQVLLPPPEIPTFAQLLQSGVVRPHEAQSILGYSDGKERRGDWDKLHSFFVVGISGSGKSSTVAYYLALAVLHGARLMVIDPDAEEDESISKRIAPLSFAFLTPVVSSPQGVGRVLDIAAKELKQPSPYPIVWVIDEFSTIMRSREWANVAPELATSVEDYAQRGRKRGRTAIVIGQIAKATRTGGTELRASMTATFIHRVPAQQARMVIDSATALAAPQLATGEVMVQLQNSVEPYRMNIPYATEEDMFTVKDMMLRRPVSSEFQTSFKPVSNQFQNPEVSEVETDMKRPESEFQRVSELIELGYKKTQIIAEVWGAVPGGSRGYQEASKKFDTIASQYGRGN